MIGCVNGLQKDRAKAAPVNPTAFKEASPNRALTWIISSLDDTSSHVALCTGRNSMQSDRQGAGFDI